MPSHFADVRIIESGGSPSAKKAQIRVSFEWELTKPIPIMNWENIYTPGWTTANIGDKGYGSWMLTLFGKVEFYEWNLTGTNIFGQPLGENITVFDFEGIDFELGFPFKSGMKGTGMYYPFKTPFIHGGIEWEVL